MEVAMKQKWVSVFLFCVFLFFAQAPAFAAMGTVSYSWTHHPQHEVSILIVTWVGGTAPDTGLVPATTLPSFQGWVFQFITDPGTPAPTAAYDITLPDANGLDVAGGTLIDRSATVTERSMPLVATSTYKAWWVDTALTFTLTNNAVSAATGTLKIYIRRRE
jgi:hypothetical protein